MTQTDLPAPPITLLRDAALFLDFDGTLVALEERPDAVRVDAGLATLIARLADALDGRLAIISGRATDTIVDLFGTVVFAIAGSHGAEVRAADGTLSRPERPAAFDRILASMTDFADIRPGVLLERKPLGAALHYRKAPEHEGDSVAFVRRLADEHGLAFQPGKMMAEVRLPGDKGTALRRLLEATPMTGHRPVFLGDDATDEPALQAAADLGGAGILVGDPRPTAATYRLPSVASVRSWLDHALEATA